MPFSAATGDMTTTGIQQGRNSAKDFENMTFGPWSQQQLAPISEKSLDERQSPRVAHAGIENTGATRLERQARADNTDPVFGNEAGAEIHYKTCEWWHAGILMFAEIVSLGVLSLPQGLATLGFVPGVLLLVFLGIIATYTGYLIGQFKLAYPAMQSFADCGELIAGSIGREMMAIGQELILIFIMAAHVLSFAIALNAMTDHGQCTVVFSVIGLFASFVLCLPRTLKNISYFSIFSCISIIVAVTIAMVAIGIQKPDMGNVLAVRPGVPLVKGLGPVMNIVLAYTGHVAFFSFCSELKDPRDFAKALAFMQTLAISFYVLISAVIYYYAGPLIASPALGSAPPLIRKIAFGIALPTIVVAGVVNGSVACKYIYLRMWSGTDVVHQKSFKSVGSWVTICAVAWVAAWAIAEAVPNFNLLLGLIAAIFCSWFSYGLPPVLWLYQHKGNWFKTKRKVTVTVLNIAIFLLGAAICILGTWSSSRELAQGAAGKPFSCENNWKPSVDI